MTPEMLKTIFTFLGPLLFGVGGWFISKNATTIKNNKGLIENKRNEVSLYKDIADDLEKRLLSRDTAIEDLRKQLVGISQQNIAISQQNIELLSKTGKLERDYSSLFKNYKELEKNYSSLLTQMQKK